jgi:broad-specificity NMP kinase
MPLEFVKQQLIREIEARGYDDHFIDLNEEREILQIAYYRAVDTESARQAMAEICTEKGYLLESVLLQQIREHVQTVTAEAGEMNRRLFDRIFHEIKPSMFGRRDDKQIQRMIVWAIEDLGPTRVRTGWFRDWYSALRKELGLG